MRKTHKQTNETYYLDLEKKLQLPMFVLTIFYLILFSIRLSDSLSQTSITIIDFLDIVIWITFIGEYLALLFYSTNKIDYIKTHVLNLLIVLIPSFRLFRLFGIFEILFGATDTLMISRILGADSKLASAAVFFANSLTYVKRLITKGKVQYIFLFVTFLVVFLGSMASIFERNEPNANITSPIEGIWWGITSITTVGYGDRYPVTWGGRIIAVMLMTIGITLFSLLTAEMSSFIIGRQEDKDKKAILKKLNELQSDIKKLDRK